jgi:hypothetical protein
VGSVRSVGSAGVTKRRSRVWGQTVGVGSEASLLGQVLHNSLIPSGHVCRRGEFSGVPAVYAARSSALSLASVPPPFSSLQRFGPSNNSSLQRCVYIGPWLWHYFLSPGSW